MSSSSLNCFGCGAVTRTPGRSAPPVYMLLLVLHTQPHGARGGARSIPHPEPEELHSVARIEDPPRGDRREGGVRGGRTGAVRLRGRARPPRVDGLRLAGVAAREPRPEVPGDV